MLVPVPRWNVAQVSDWVAVLGLPQYRKRFIHQCISGPLLLQLNHTLLKVLPNQTASAAKGTLPCSRTCECALELLVVVDKPDCPPDPCR